MIDYENEWDVDWIEDEDWRDFLRDDPERACLDCYAPDAICQCDCCGGPLCHQCAEGSGNFCNGCLADPNFNERMAELYVETNTELPF